MIYAPFGLPLLSLFNGLFVTICVYVTNVCHSLQQAITTHLLVRFPGQPV